MKTKRRRQSSSYSENEVVETRSKKQKKNVQKKSEKKEKSGSGVIPTLQQKCSLVNFQQIVKMVKPKAKVEVWDVLRRTSFWPMISPIYHCKVHENHFSKHERDLEIILQYYDVEKRKFFFGDKEMEIMVEDIERIFGLPNSGEVINNVGRNMDKDKRKPSTIFDVKMIKDTVDKQVLLKRLEAEVDKEEKGDARIIAALIIMVLFTTCFFSKSTVSITWDLINACEDIERINQYNWPKMILEFLLDGLMRHEKKKPKVLSGCLILIYYWFLEKTQVKHKITGKERSTPTFLRWSIRELFTTDSLKDNPDIAVEFITKGPWNEESNRGVSDSEDVLPLTFGDWVPQKSQEKPQEKVPRATTDSLKDIATEDVEKDLIVLIIELHNQKRKLQENAKMSSIAIEEANAKILQQTLEISKLEDENKRQKKYIEDLTLQLAKAHEVECREEEEEDVCVNFTENILETPREKEKDEGEVLDCLVEMIQKSAETNAPIKPVEKMKKPVPMHSIERNVKLYKRKGTKKAKDDDFKYNTPKEVKDVAMPNKRKKAPKQPLPRKNNKEEPEKKKQVIKKVVVNFEKDTWTTLKTEVQNYYKAFLDTMDDDADTFWASQTKPIVVQGTDIIDLVEENYMSDSVIKAYTDILQRELENANIHIAAFLEIEASFYAIKHEEERGSMDYKNQIKLCLIEPLWYVFDYNKVLIPIHHCTNHHYTLLVVDNEEKRIVHMNSLQPPENERDEEEKYHKKAGYVVKHLMKFLQEVELSNKHYPEDSGETDIENYRYKSVGETNQGDLDDRILPMNDREKMVRRWVLDNFKAIKEYKLEEDFDCPQQNSQSADCGPFVLHFMQKLALGEKPNKVDADGMRKVILEKLMKARIQMSSRNEM